MKFEICERHRNVLNIWAAYTFAIKMLFKKIHMIVFSSVPKTFVFMLPFKNSPNLKPSGMREMAFLSWLSQSLQCCKARGQAQVGPACS